MQGMLKETLEEVKNEGILDKIKNLFKKDKFQKVKDFIDEEVPSTTDPVFSIESDEVKVMWGTEMLVNNFLDKVEKQINNKFPEINTRVSYQKGKIGLYLSK